MSPYLLQVGLDEVPAVGVDVVPDVGRGAAHHTDLVVGNIRGVPEQTQQVMVQLIQGCGSAFILCGSGSRSRFRSSLTKFEEKKIMKSFLKF